MLSIHFETFVLLSSVFLRVEMCSDGHLEISNCELADIFCPIFFLSRVRWAAEINFQIVSYATVCIGRSSELCTAAIMEMAAVDFMI